MLLPYTIGHRQFIGEEHLPDCSRLILTTDEPISLSGDRYILVASLLWVPSKMI